MGVIGVRQGFNNAMFINVKLREYYISIVLASDDILSYIEKTTKVLQRNYICTAVMTATALRQ